MAGRRSPPGVTLHRFFVPREAIQGEQVTFGSDLSYQIRRVLRLGPGDRVVALDGTGAELLVRLIDVQGNVIGGVEECSRNKAEPSVDLALYLGVLKGTKLELVLQKCTEIGVAKFVPLLTQRSLPSKPGTARQRRFEAIVREAAEQSRRGRLPIVSQALSYGEAIGRAASQGPVVLLWEGESVRRLSDLNLPSENREIGLMVGPEGGFTPVEAAIARSAGAHVVTLGPRILRAETAAIVGTALLLTQLGEIG